VFLPSVLAGALLVFGLLQLRPDRGAERADTLRLVNHFVDPPGYQTLGDDAAGAGPVPVEGAGVAMSNDARLSSADLAGYVIGHTRAWGRASGEPARGVVVFISEYAGAPAADRVRDLLRARRSTVTGVDGVPGGFAFVDAADDGGRHFQRVAFTRGKLLFVVSIVTPGAEPVSSELTRIATAHYDRA
jgi:hypothetical protein